MDKKCSTCQREFCKTNILFLQCDCSFKICEDCFDTSEQLFEQYKDNTFGNKCILCRVYRKSRMKDLKHSIQYPWYYLPDKPIKYF